MLQALGAAMKDQTLSFLQKNVFCAVQTGMHFYATAAHFYRNASLFGPGTDIKCGSDHLYQQVLRFDIKGPPPLCFHLKPGLPAQIYPALMRTKFLRER